MDTALGIAVLIVLSAPAFAGACLRLRGFGHRPNIWRIAMLTLAVSAILVTALGYLSVLAEYHASTYLDADTCARNASLCSWVDIAINFSGWLVTFASIAVGYFFVRYVAATWPGVLSRHAQS
jgi:hypothetical protein